MESNKKESIQEQSPEEIIKQEVVLSDDKNKTVYHYLNSERDIDIKTKEVFKKEDKTIFHQLRTDWRTKEVIPKYKTIKTITLEGMRGSLPLGFSTKASRNYGVTKTLSPLIKFLDKDSDFEDITLSKDKKTGYSKTKLTINIKDLEFVRKNISSLIRLINEKNKVFVQNYFADKFPSQFGGTFEKYQKGTIYRLLSEYRRLDKELNSDDKTALFDLFEKLSLSDKKIFEQKDWILAKEKIEKKFIEDVISEFERLISLKRIKEDTWQKFFKKNAWIFSQIFAYPTVLFKDQAYLGGKSIHGKGGKYIDFLYENKLTKNSALIEIKKHTTKILSQKPYRGENVYCIDKEVSGAISQVLDLKHTYNIKFESIREEGDIQSFNPKCILIIGLHNNLQRQQIGCFELFRNNLKDIEIVTFDELLEKIRATLNLFKHQDAKPKSKIQKN